MSHVKDIITDKEKLYEWCTEVDTRKDSKLIQEIVLALKATMRENNLVCLAAPQIGYARRIFCLRFGADDYRSFINPVIENNVGFQMSRETCASLPGKTFIIPRFNQVKVFYTTPLGKPLGGTFAGKAAFEFQNAMDMLNGSLIDDIGLEIDEDYDNASEEDRAEILRMYAESLDIRYKNLRKDIDADQELTDIEDAVKFINSVKNGETQIEYASEGEKE